MSIIDEAAWPEGAAKADIRALRDSHQRLLKAAIKIREFMDGRKGYENFKLTLETAIDEAEKLTSDGGS
jgi:hypothetical protein